MCPKNIDFAAELAKFNRTIAEIRNELASKATEEQLDLLCTCIKEENTK